MRNQNGFTLVELILALAVFSFALTIVVSGFLLTARQYEQSVAVSKAQQNARFGMEEISRELRRVTDISNVRLAPVSPPYKKLCIIKGGGTISYQLNTKVLTRYDGGDGASSCYSGTASTAITNTDVKVQVLEFSKDTTTNTVNIKLKTATVGSTLDANFDCVPDGNSSFCATAPLETAIEIRGGS